MCLLVQLYGFTSADKALQTLELEHSMEEDVEGFTTAVQMAGEEQISEQFQEILKPE